VIKAADAVMIGGGPAGLFCAVHAAVPGHRVMLLEKNAMPGAKLLLTGSGQCNITHAGTVSEFLSHYGKNGRFLRAALHGFSNDDLIQFFSGRGLAMAAEENGKVFPETRASADVLSVLIRECREKGVELRCAEQVEKIVQDRQGFIVQTGKTVYYTSAVVITTGGMSYPVTGSSGDGYRFAAALGQPLTETAPALTPLRISSFPFAALSGISFESLPFSVWRDGKKVADHSGDLLFTHLGLSGPGILDASRDIRAGDGIRLSFVGAMRREEFAQDLARRVQENPGWQVRTILAAYPIPERLNRKLLTLSGIPDDLTCAHFSAAQRSKLVTNCTEFPLTVAALGGYPVAMATRGGVALEGVNQKTMESTIVPGLFFAGEVLDIDGDTGGYNLQAAFSTGYLAALGVRKRWESGGHPP
jgi:predicted Rossmann fold flavoprotein